jgi:threonine aldolase
MNKNNKNENINFEKNSLENILNKKRYFASDNCSKVHQDIMKALFDENNGHAFGYGYDETTNKAVDLIKKHLKRDCEVFFVYNGTGANILAISHILKPYEAVITCKTSHINHHETGGLERFGGNKIIYIETLNGKLKVSDISKNLREIGDEHVVQPKIVTISQPTEYGGVYTKEELNELSDFVHKHNMLLHIDGARIFNAAVFLNETIDEVIGDVDILSFGGTKNGLMFGEVIVFFKKNIDEDLIKSFKWSRKQGMQLHSKMRFIACQYLEYFKSDLPYRLALNSNKLGEYLEFEIDKLKKYFFDNIDKIKIKEILKSKNFDKYFTSFIRRETNQIFVFFPLIIYEKVCSQYPFYIWDEENEVVRFVTSWDNTKEDVDNFIKYIKEIIF